MKYSYFIKQIVVFSILLIGISCNKNSFEKLECLPDVKVVYEFESPDGIYVKIYENGEGYTVDDGGCQFAEQIFTPGFLEDHYLVTDSGISIIIDENIQFTPYRNFEEDFENESAFHDLFIKNVTQTDRLFTSFTLQSPSAKTVEEYVALRKCILEKTCDFIDNRIDLSLDPVDNNNLALKFSSEAPTSDMVTSKCSISTGLAFFQKGDDFWYEAKYYIEKGFPTTLADFESSYFHGSIGPRIIFRGDKLAIENKFGDKITYNQDADNAVTFPLNKWVKVKVHLKYDETNGFIQVWQDDQLIVDKRGQNIPVDFWIQDNIEVGISATSEKTILYIDDIKFSENPF